MEETSLSLSIQVNLGCVELMIDHTWAQSPAQYKPGVVLTLTIPT